MNEQNREQEVKHDSQIHCDGARTSTASTASKAVTTEPVTGAKRKDSMTNEQMLANLRRAMKEGKLSGRNLTTRNVARTIGVSTARLRSEMVEQMGSVEAFWKAVGSGRDR
jgi:hypothetical protein